MLHVTSVFISERGEASVGGGGPLIQGRSPHPCAGTGVQQQVQTLNNSRAAGVVAQQHASNSMREAGACT
jgi:hypothetical protein